jgi:hypothetical protein
MVPQFAFRGTAATPASAPLLCRVRAASDLDRAEGDPGGPFRVHFGADYETAKFDEHPISKFRSVTQVFPNLLNLFALFLEPYHLRAYPCV